MSGKFIGVLTLIAAMLPAALHADEKGSSDRQVERDTFALINQYRVADQLPAFAWNDDIAEIARAHSRDMALEKVDFGHDGFGGRMHQIRKQFPGLHAGGENVLMTSDPADVARQAVALWLKSPPHLHNIRSSFNLSGVGVWVSPAGTFYFTEIFARVSPSEDEN